MFRFTIRELLLLTVIVALAVGWWQRERHLSERLWRNRAETLKSLVEAHEWKVAWDGHNDEVTTPHGTTYLSRDIDQF